ncbi:AEC family transporter [Marinibaculum pumilum]|uniref:AEC family transporter n=1 Tax=Marinibaculum pumilum TaxID=1766165 RepID=A0ABV7L9Y3_9PROT
MEQLVFILVFLAIGVLLRLSGRLPEASPKVLGGWVINVALPATALKSVHAVVVAGDWLLAAATPWLGAALALAVLLPAGRAFRWSRQRTGGLLLVAGWGNTSFVGIPMILAFAGTDWVALGLMIDLFGSYLALSILGIGIAAVASEGRLPLRAVALRIVTFPPFVALLMALATNHLARPAWLEEGIGLLAATMTPIALAAVGFALRLDRVAGRLLPLCAALGFRLLLAPAALLALYLVLEGGGLMTADPPVRNVAVLEMAMPPMLGAAILAMEHDLEPDLVALVIGIGIPLSLATATLWWQVLLFLS